MKMKKKVKIIVARLEQIPIVIFVWNPNINIIFRLLLYIII